MWKHISALNLTLFSRVECERRPTRRFVLLAVNSDVISGQCELRFTSAFILLFHRLNHKTTHPQKTRDLMAKLSNSSGFTQSSAAAQCSLARLAAAVGGGDDDGEDVGGDDDVALQAGAADPSSCHTNPSLNPAMCLSHGPSPHPQTVTCFLIEPLPPPSKLSTHRSAVVAFRKGSSYSRSFHPSTLPSFSSGEGARVQTARVQLHELVSSPKWFLIW